MGSYEMVRCVAEMIGIIAPVLRGMGWFEICRLKGEGEGKGVGEGG